jgi:hypothetical protein
MIGGLRAVQHCRGRRVVQAEDEDRRVRNRAEGGERGARRAAKALQKQVFTRAEITKAYNLAGACIAMLTNAIIAQEKRE